MSNSPKSKITVRRILGVDFFAGTAVEALAVGVRGGLVVVPAAPALVEMVTDHSYREALLEADLVLTDSGFMVLIWNLISADRLRRVSGLEYIKLLLDHPTLDTPGSVLWVMPSTAARDRNLAWLRSKGLSFSTEDCYVAPLYPRNRTEDPDLVALVQHRKPRHVVICVGGGVQEKLGLHLKRHCDHVAAIHCIGAAIGFLSGDQVAIPNWADRWFLGWLLRCLWRPRQFVPRYLRALRLAPMLIRYRERLPSDP